MARLVGLIVTAALALSGVTAHAVPATGHQATAPRAGHQATAPRAGHQATAHRARHSARCSPQRHAVIARGGGIVVYGRAHGHDIFDGAVTDVEACRRPHGRPVLLGIAAASDGEYPPNEIIGSVRVAAPLVAAASIVGEANASACESVQTECYGLVTDSVIVLDVRTRRRVAITADGALQEVALTRDAVAWIMQTGPDTETVTVAALHGGRPAGAPRTLATGRISTRGFGFTGSTLHWLQNGQAQSGTA